MKIRHMDLALKAAHHSDHPKFQIGAVIASGNRVISIGYNQYKTHPRAKGYTIHAELKAILTAHEDVRGCEIYVVRQRKDGSLALAKPCPHCVELLAEVGIRQVYFTSNGAYESMVISG